MVSVGEEPDFGPDGPLDNVPHKIRQPEYRRALPAPRVSSSTHQLGPPAPVVDEAAASARDPPVDLTRSPGFLYVTVEIPGAEKETIHVEATEGHLTIQARAYNGFVYRKRIELPDPIDPNSVRASYRNGVLDIAIPMDRARKVRVRRGKGHG